MEEHAWGQLIYPSLYVVLYTLTIKDREGKGAQE